MAELTIIGMVPVSQPAIKAAATRVVLCRRHADVPLTHKVRAEAPLLHVLGYACHVGRDALVATDRVLRVADLRNNILHVDMNGRAPRLQGAAAWGADLVRIWKQRRRGKGA